VVRGPHPAGALTELFLDYSLRDLVDFWGLRWDRKAGDCVDRVEEFANETGKGSAVHILGSMDAPPAVISISAETALR